MVVVRVGFLRDERDDVVAKAPLIVRFLSRIIRQGDLTIIDWHGRHHRLGSGGFGNPCAVRLHDPSLNWKLLADPELQFGEAYMDGRITIEEGDVRDVASVFAFNRASRNLPSFTERMLTRLGIVRRLQQWNSQRTARRNVAAHYDISNEIYALFLDEDWQYSCAYYKMPSESLEDAQRNKCRLIGAKLAIEPGMRVLDIGCGWGGLALHLAETYGCRVKGITLSQEQVDLANRRAQERRMAHKVTFALQDYREEEEDYDRIVSVGMFEHVGVGNYPEFLRIIRQLLAPDGVALLHSIGRRAGPGVTSSWVRRYIFPGGYIPALSEVVPLVEKSDLWITDIEILRLHYARTLQHWYERFQHNRGRAEELRDERFCRMWELYLAGAEMSFRYMGKMVFQMQLTRSQDAAPLTRSYLQDVA